VLSFSSFSLSKPKNKVIQLILKLGMESLKAESKAIEERGVEVEDEGKGELNLKVSVGERRRNVYGCS